MTREEVIQGLQFTIEMFLFDPSTGETLTEPRNNLDKATIDACKGAIELLKQQPCEDCISREEALKGMCDKCPKYNCVTECASHRHIKKMTPVTPTRPHGEWEETVVLPRAYDIMGNKTWASQMRCNKCEFTTFAVEGKFSQYNFCPNCGADMREEVQDEGKHNYILS